MLHVDENLLAIDAEVDRVASEFVKSDEARRYREARHSFLSDSELQDNLRLLNDNLEFLDFQKDLRDLQKKITLNEQVYQLKLAENDLQQLLSNLTKTLASGVSQHILIDENLPLKGGGHHRRRKLERH